MCSALCQLLFRAGERIRFRPPAAPAELSAFRIQWPHTPGAILALWRVSDGLEIADTGTVLYSVWEAAHTPRRRGTPLGRMSFGDPLYMDREGRVLQIDREDGGVFLTWPSLAGFLRDELAAPAEEEVPCSGGN